MKETTLAQRFAEKFKDITHFGCPSTPEVPCETLRIDLLSFIQAELLLLAGEQEKLFKNGTRAEEHIYDMAIDDAVRVTRSKAAELN